MRNLITFYGGDSQVGVTMVALSAARLLAKKGRRVFFIYASQNPGNDFIRGSSTTSIDDLRHGIADGSLTLDELNQNVFADGQIDILPSVRSFSSAVHYQEDAIEYIYDLAKNKYDYIIADGGCGGWSLSSWAIRKAGILFVVLTQQEKCVQRFRLRKGMLRDAEGEVCYIVNKFNHGGVFYNMEDMRGWIGCGKEEICKIPYVPYGWQAESDRETLLHSKTFVKGMKDIITWVEQGETVGTKE